MGEAGTADASLRARQEAASLVQAQRYGEATAVLRAAAMASPDDWKIRKELAHLLLRLSDHSGARQAFFAAFHATQRLAEESVRSAAQTALLGGIVQDGMRFADAGYLTAAEHILDLVTHLFPDSVDAAVAHATILERQKEWKRLGEAARRLAALKPDDTKLLRWAAGTLARAGRWREAVPLIRRVWRMKPVLAAVTLLGRQPALLNTALAAQWREARDRATLVAAIAVVGGAAILAGLAQFAGWHAAAGAAIGAATAALAAEMSLRLRLWRECHVPGEALIMPPIDWTDTDVVIHVSDKCPVEYDAVAGFRYRAHEVVVTGTLQNGRALTATRIAMTADGFMQPSQPPRDQGPRIAVFGDSFAGNLLSQTGLHWPHFFGEAIERKLGRPVQVINRGREFYSLPQMVTIAADMARRTPPDLIVLTYISRAIRRERSWAHRAIIGGQERFLRSPTAGPRPHVLTAYDAGAIDGRVTLEWLQAHARTPGWDPLLEDIWRRFLLYRQRGDYRCFGLFDTDRSVLLNHFFYGDAFGFPQNVSQRQRRFLRGPEALETDERFLADVAVLKAARVPIVLVHVPVRQEIQAKTMASNERDLAIKERFEQKLGTPSIPLLPWVLRQNFDLTQFCLDERDDHPTALGERIYGEAVADALIDQGVIAPLFKEVTS